MSHVSEVAIVPEDPRVRLVRATLAEALAAPIDRSQGIYTVDGMSGARYRHFINTLIRVASALVVEIRNLFWLGSGARAGEAGRSVRPLPKPRV